MKSHTPQLASCLYSGTIRHRRFSPVEHHFQYRVRLLYLDLDETAIAFGNSWFWSTRRWAPVRYCRSDHFGDERRPLAECVRELVEVRTGIAPCGPIRLLTQPRYLGFVMNPVSLYYCFDSDGKSLDALVAEVNNTPWGERYLYVIDGRTADDSPTLRESHDKEFHVSPFLPMTLLYHWTVTPPGSSLHVHLEDHDDRGKVFDATLNLQRTEISPAALRRSLLTYPLMTWRIYAGIHWQAVRLWWKGLPVHSHPGGVVLSQPRSDSIAAESTARHGTLCETPPMVFHST